MPGKQSMLYLYVNMAVGVKDRIDDGEFDDDAEDLQDAQEVLADLVKHAQKLIDKRGAELGYLADRAESVGIHP